LGEGVLILWGILIAGTAYLAALAVGRVRLRGVRDDGDAKLARWLLGTIAAVTGIGVGFAQGDPISSIMGACVAVAGAAVVVTAKRRALTDQTTRVAGAEIVRAAHEFVFESGTPARGSIDVRLGRGWTWFVGFATIGFSVFLVAVALDLASNGNLDDVGGALFALGFGIVFLVVLIAPGLWLFQRAFRGIPLLRIDERGMVMGRDRRRDLWVDWADVEEVGVRVNTGGGVTDRVIIVETSDRWPLEHQSRKARWTAGICRVLYGAPFSLSTIGHDIAVEEVLARIAAHRPEAIRE